MPRIHLDEDIKPVTEFRAQAAALIDRIRSTKRAMVLTQRGHSAAVVLDVAEYERLLEELELLRDVVAADRQIAQGQGLPHETARERVLQAISAR